MYLKRLQMASYRACRDTEVELSADLTVIVGENAAGKSAIVDAIRLATFPASGRPTAWFSAERDLNRDTAAGEPVVLSTRYSGLSEAEQAIYLAQLADPQDDLVYTASFATAPGTPRRSVLTWAVAESRDEDPEPALRRRIAHVYLPPLRDAVRDLDGADQSELHGVLRLLIGDDASKEDDFVSTANAALQTIADHSLAQETQSRIQSVFTKTMPPNREHTIKLNKRELELRRLVRLLRLQLAEGETPVGDIASTGLGYANLLYMALVVVQLVNAKDSDLTLLLVEEPEAHLHPQLQLVLLEFLREQAQATDPVEPSDLKPTGKVQVVVTTHSPILASTVSVNNVVVVARSTEAGGSWCAKATALGQLGLNAADVRKVDRYLNSTRAALLFARDVILVEGIAESLMLPALAHRHLAAKADDHASTGSGGTPLTPEEKTQRLQRWLRQFSSASIVSVEGVDFEPYLHVLLDGKYPRIDRVVVVTDRDTTGAGDTRKTAYEATFPDDVAAGRLSVQVGQTTLEAELFRHPGNELVLRKAFQTLHPKSLEHWDNVAAQQPQETPDVRAARFAQAIQAKSATAEYYLDIGKGDFAHLVSEAVESDTEASFEVPAYLAAAIEQIARVPDSTA